MKRGPHRRYKTVYILHKSISFYANYVYCITVYSVLQIVLRKKWTSCSKQTATYQTNRSKGHIILQVVSSLSEWHKKYCFCDLLRTMYCREINPIFNHVLFPWKVRTTLIPSCETKSILVRCTWETTGWNTMLPWNNLLDHRFVFANWNCTALFLAGFCFGSLVDYAACYTFVSI